MKAIKLLLILLIIIPLITYSQYTCPNSNVYIRVVYNGSPTNVNTNPGVDVPFNFSTSCSGNNGSYSAYWEVQNVTYEFYSDAAYTQPLSLTNFPLRVQQPIIDPPLSIPPRSYTSNVVYNSSNPLPLVSGTSYSATIVRTVFFWLQDINLDCEPQSFDYALNFSSNCRIADSTELNTNDCSKTFTLASSKTNKCFDETVNLSISNPNGYPGGITSYFNDFQWYRNGTAVVGANSTTYATSNDGQFHVRGFNKDAFGNIYCSTITDTITITNRIIDTSLNNTQLTICEPGTVQLCSNQLGTGYNYTWTDGTNSLPTSTNPCVIWSNPGTVTIYCIIDSLGYCSTNSSVRTIQINALPINTVQATYNGVSNVDLCSYQTAPGTLYQWYRNTSPIPSATNRCYTATGNGSYYCYITSPEGCSRYSDTTLVVGLLAVKILDFTGSKNAQGHNTLSWKLSDLIDFEALSIEVSYDNLLFTEVFKTTSISVISYRHEESKSSYYRLKIKNKNKTYTYSKIVYINSQADVLEKISPNPTNGIANIYVNTKTAQYVVISIYNNLGQLINSSTVNIKKGDNIIKKDIAQSPNGVYTISIKGTTINQSIKIIKQ